MRRSSYRRRSHLVVSGRAPSSDIGGPRTLTLERDLQSDARPELATRGEPFWPAQLAAGMALLFYLTLPHRLIMGPRWLVPGVEGILLLALVVTTPTRH
ncbi:MAG TPA: hypothetical protein VKG38_17320, partial [Solirubrobacteraceae bacterium]|nr:hypothetical protein [Solirubrobacteraceae bacterium]